MVTLMDPCTLLLLPVLKTKLPIPLKPLKVPVCSETWPVTTEFALIELPAFKADRVCVVMAMPVELAPPLIVAKSTVLTGAGRLDIFTNSAATADLVRTPVTRRPIQMVVAKIR
jgi:hypothetical protein